MADTTDVRQDTLDRVDWPVATPRLVLRRALPEDADALFAYRSLPVVDRWLTQRFTRVEEWRAHHGEPDRLATTLVVERDGDVVGDLYLAVRDGWAQQDVVDRPRPDEAEIGWAFAPSHQGHGYATEAVRALLRVCFEDLGLRRVVANAFADNEPSWRLMERVGMRREGVGVRDSLHRDLGWVDGVTYALLADEPRGGA
ncbi:GNAT family N-acetyltransferase [Cellulosimicrobium protaetiae]|uniref:GNAT family N-acetyltransferase n=1 Tax=Cellulosimicrobium protaetiae TaxID=2587808 RepID=A0A6M5UE30_9MICO|nr:GNAT family protein [Cellulosimicrobium protaetiae]QJW36756.1 GNAT family N-acetyltransferase [Cellulosimicrobium protaetiae]